MDWTKNHFPPEHIVAGNHNSVRATAYLFPGQGAQAVGMGKELYEKSDAAKAVFREVDAALGRPLTKLVFEGPSEELRRTVNAQPAIMAVSLACFKAMEESFGGVSGPEPILMAGHSLGEYTALVVSGVLEVGEAACLVQERGRLMQEACDQRPGSMAAILGLDEMTIEEISRETGTYVSNINTPQQVVISGDRMLVAQALDLAVARGAKKVAPLQVGGAFHSALMEPATVGLADAISKLHFRDPQVPIVANCTGEPLTSAEGVRRELVSQISNCVLWSRSIDYMLRCGVSCFVELGPGRTLSSMVKRIDKSTNVVSVGDMDSILDLRRN